jgi:hypothetical protein
MVRRPPRIEQNEYESKAIWEIVRIHLKREDTRKAALEEKQRKE